jgi:prepilin-type N-terminal cleavage/methylation domain-containing protein
MKRISSIKSGRTGFTLIELMVVMLLISIVLAVAIPRFEGGVFQDPGKKMSRWMINTVRTLRSAAIQKQDVQSLVLDLSNRKMWIANGRMSEQERAAAAEKAYSLPAGINIVDVQFPGRDPITSGTIDILFYPAAYSDHVLIHLENENAERSTYRIAPLLPKVKIFDEWIDF